MNHFVLLIASLLAAPEHSISEKSAPAQNTAATTAMTQESRSALIIEPKSRAQDYTQAFEFLRKEKPTLKINIQTTNGMLANVAELSSSDNGTLMLVKVPFSQGTKYLVVPVEDIKEISYSP